MFGFLVLPSRFIIWLFKRYRVGGSTERGELMRLVMGFLLTLSFLTSSVALRYKEDGRESLERLFDLFYC